MHELVYARTDRPVAFRAATVFPVAALAIFPARQCHVLPVLLVQIGRRPAGLCGPGTLR